MMLGTDGSRSAYTFGTWLEENGPGLLQAAQELAVLWPYALGVGITGAVGLVGLRHKDQAVHAMRTYLPACPTGEITLGKRREKDVEDAMVDADSDAVGTNSWQRFGEAARRLLWASLVALVLWAMLVFLGPDTAHAQQGGGDGGAIQGAIDAARDWLSSIMMSLGGLGMIASIGVKAVARQNENMHHAAHMGMTGSGIAIVAGLLINDIISLLQSFAGGGA
jgi:hypothetical protein